RFAPRDDGENYTSNHQLPHHAATVHLVFEIDHRRPGEVPGETRAPGAAADDGFGNDRGDIVNGVGLRRGCVLPTMTELGHALFHHADDIADLLRDAFGTEVAVAHRAFGIGTPAFLRLAAAGDHEGRRRGLARPREGEGIE